MVFCYAVISLGIDLGRFLWGFLNALVQMDDEKSTEINGVKKGGERSHSHEGKERGNTSADE